MFGCDMIKNRKFKQYILVFSLTILLAGALYVTSLLLRQEGAYAVVYVGDKESVRFSLAENREYVIESEDGGENVLKIEDGHARVISANCHNQVCVHSKAISFEGESIVCLPHQVKVEVKGGKEAEYDAIAN